jgi:predicted MFS family arabinose efflux permease
VTNRMAERQRQLAILAIALVLAMSPWFATAAVLGELRERWNLSRQAASWLTIVVQLDFVGGAVFTSVTNLADRVSPRRLILVGAIGAAASNALVVLGDSFAIAIVARLLTGAFLAGVYPPALKAMSTWYRTGRGLALGVMIGALTLGSALPHAINPAGGFDWKPTLLLVSAMALTGGIIAERLGSDGPHAATAASFDRSQLRAIAANRDFRLASLGYFGHMWELYAMWAWIAAFYGDAFVSRRGASFAAFVVIAAGAAGSVYAGLVSDRRTRPEAAALAMRWSASVAVAMRFLIDAPWPIVVGVGVGRRRQCPVLHDRDRGDRCPLRRDGAHHAACCGLCLDRLHDLSGPRATRRARLGVRLLVAGAWPHPGGVGDASAASGPAQAPRP